MGMCGEQESHFAAPGSEVFDANSAVLFTSCLSQELSRVVQVGLLTEQHTYLGTLSTFVNSERKRELTCEMVGVRKAI